jgi:NAD-dependent dihydropyrimidine dehydrogenase PreA subunit
MQRTYDTCGMTEAAEQAGLALNLDMGHEVRSHPEGKLIRRFEVITPVLRADAVVNLCKLKTHLFTGMTGAVKNLFGVVPGLTKPGYHAKLSDTRRFAAMMLDLADLIAPRLSIMDAVVGMEGDGPSSGSPRKVGWLLASRSPLALDAAAGEIMGLAWADNPLLLEAEERELSPANARDVELVGATLSDLRVRDYVLPSVSAAGTGISEGAWWGGAVTWLMRHTFSSRPVVAPDRCVACGACVRVCPMDVITLEETGGRACAEIDDSDCIRCYCCHEMCPEDAIDLHTSLLGKLLGRG